LINVGTFNLCWSHIGSEFSSAFRTHVGQVVVGGPQPQQSWSGFTHRPLSMNVLGTSLSTNNALLVVQSSQVTGAVTSPCGNAAYQGIQVISLGGLSTRMHFGNATSTTGEYIVCWRPGIPPIVDTAMQTSAQAYSADIGRLTVAGPHQDTHHAIIHLKSSLTITGLSLGSSSRIRVLSMADSCGSSENEVSHLKLGNAAANASAPAWLTQESPNGSRGKTCQEQSRCKH
jgi:hypothetical protein